MWFYSTYRPKGYIHVHITKYSYPYQVLWCLSLWKIDLSRFTFLENVTHESLHLKVFNKGSTSTSLPFILELRKIQKRLNLQGVWIIQLLNVNVFNTESEFKAESECKDWSSTEPHTFIHSSLCYGSHSRIYYVTHSPPIAWCQIYLNKLLWVWSHL